MNNFFSNLAWIAAGAVFLFLYVWFAQNKLAVKQEGGTWRAWFRATTAAFNRYIQNHRPPVVMTVVIYCIAAAAWWTGSLDTMLVFSIWVLQAVGVLWGWITALVTGVPLPGAIPDMPTTTLFEDRQIDGVIVLLGVLIWECCNRYYMKKYKVNEPKEPTP